MNDEGPAFPNQPPVMGPNGHLLYGEQGMSLRDYFAAKALSHFPILIEHADENLSYENIADHCYNLADAMLKAREAK